MSAFDKARPIAPIAANGLAIKPSFRQSWDTSEIRASERFSYFREAMCQTFLACTPESRPNEKIAARIDMVALSEGWASRYNTSIARLTRTPADVKAISEEYISLILITAGQKQTQYERKSLFFQKGDVVIVNANQFFDSHKCSNGPISQMGLTLRRSTLKRMVGADFTADFIIAKNLPLSAALLSCLEIIDKRLTAGSQYELSALYDACQALVAALLARDPELFEAASDASRGISESLVTSIKSFVDRNLKNPDLSPAFVACKFGISVRYVHKLFDKTDNTFSKYILHCRLDRVRAELMKGIKADNSLEKIAHQWGFQDMSSFHRNFKRRYDITPNQMRYSIDHY